MPANTASSSDYYARLNLKKGANADELKKAYRKLAMKWHPDRNSSAEAKTKFQEISQAYDVLSNPEKRKIYDKYGEAGLTGGVPPPSGSSSSSYGSGGGYGGMGSGFGSPQGTSNFSQNDAEEIFRTFFGGGGMGGFGGGGGMGGSGFSFGGAGGGGSGGPGIFSFSDAFGQQQHQQQQGFGGGGVSSRGKKRMAAQPVKRDLPVSLEQLAEGFKKRMKITRRVQKPNSGVIEAQSKVVTIEGKPGWKGGTKVTFAGAGDELGGAPAQDVQFVVVELPHSRFRRDTANTDNLICTIHVPLADALCGTQVRVDTIDGRSVNLNLPRVSPSEFRIVTGAGMPKKGGRGRGDLRVEFKVDFPAHSLSDPEKAQVRALFGGR